jgi:hypothetical protein
MPTIGNNITNQTQDPTFHWCSFDHNRDFFAICKLLAFPISASWRHWIPEVTSLVLIYWHLFLSSVIEAMCVSVATCKVLTLKERGFQFCQFNGWYRMEKYSSLDSSFLTVNCVHFYAMLCYMCDTICVWEISICDNHKHLNVKSVVTKLSHTSLNRLGLHPCHVWCWSHNRWQLNDMVIHHTSVTFQSLLRRSTRSQIMRFHINMSLFTTGQCSRKVWL